MFTMKNRTPNSPVSDKPKHARLSWPGLKAKDRLSRVITQTVKESKESKENEEWAAGQVARLLDFVPPETAMKLVLQESCRRRNVVP
jgi:hypothetical protein